MGQATRCDYAITWETVPGPAPFAAAGTPAILSGTAQLSRPVEGRPR